MTPSKITSKRLAQVSCLLSVASAAVLIVMAVWLNQDPDYRASPVGREFLTSLPDVGIAFSFAIVGSFVSLKRPENLVGWAMVLSGSGLMVGGLFGAYADLGLFAKPELDLPLAAAAASVEVASWTPLMAGVFLLLVTFPSGRPQSRRWRNLSIAVLIGFVLITVGISTAPGKLDAPYDDFDNELALPFGEALFIAVIPVILFCLLSVGAAAINLIRRFRRSRGDEREQYKWLAFSAGVLVLTMPFSAATDFKGIPGTIVTMALIALPVSVGIAVLRYRLYDIDRIINRALVYALVTLTLVLAYAGLVVGLQRALESLSGGSNLAVALTTLVVAGLFLPIRQRVQSLVDRRFNRRSYDGAKTVDAFAARLREQIDLDTLRYELLAVLDETMQPAGASVWLRGPESEARA